MDWIAPGKVGTRRTAGIAASYRTARTMLASLLASKGMRPVHSS
jgi:hypothetical protein